MNTFNRATGILSKPDPELDGLLREFRELARRLRSIQDFTGVDGLSSLVALHKLLAPWSERNLMAATHHLHIARNSLFKKVQFPFEALQEHFRAFGPGVGYNTAPTADVVNDSNILIGYRAGHGPALRSVQYWKEYRAGDADGWNGNPLKNGDPQALVKRQAVVIVQDNIPLILSRIECILRLL